MAQKYILCMIKLNQDLFKIVYEIGIIAIQPREKCQNRNKFMFTTCTKYINHQRRGRLMLLEKV